MAIAYDKTEEYTTGIAAEVRTALEGRGAKVTAFEAYDTGYVDEAGEAAANCDVVGVPAPSDSRPTASMPRR